MSTDRFDVSGKVVLITGAGQGIGRDYALAFADAGAKPVLAEINAENLKMSRQTLRLPGARHSQSKLTWAIQTPWRPWQLRRSLRMVRLTSSSIMQPSLHPSQLDLFMKSRMRSGPR